ncbi:10446_t:CDS:2, partial [Cetraspora pellucida]
TEIFYKFGVQLGDSYGVENNITNTSAIDTAINEVFDGASTADSSTLDNWGFLQTFIWQEDKNVIYSIPHRPYINANTLNKIVSPNLNDHNVVSKNLNAQAQAPGQPVQAWNITNLSNLHCGPIGIDTTKGAAIIRNMENNGGIYGLDNRVFSLTPIDGADAIITGKTVPGFDVSGLDLSKIYIIQRIQVAINVLFYVQNSWPGTSLRIHASTLRYMHSTIVYNSVNIAIAGIMLILIFGGTVFLTSQIYKITWAGTIGQTTGLILGNIDESLFGACVDNMPKDDGNGQLYYVCSTEKSGVKHLELSTNSQLAIPKLKGFYAGVSNCA